VDSHQPEVFGVEYNAGDGTRKQPALIHRALLGSIERFFAILLEHYAGAFPAWLAPLPVVGIPGGAEYDGYLSEIIDRLRADGVRAELDPSDDRMQKKIRNHTTAKVPFQ